MKIFSENQFSGKTYFYTIVNRELVNLGLMNWFEAATETATVNAGSATGAAEATDAPLV